MPASEIVYYTMGLEKAVSPVCCINIKVVCTTVASAMNIEYHKEWLDAMESELKRIRASDVTVLTPVLNVPKKVTSIRWAFKVKSDGRLKARLVAFAWRQMFDCGIKFTSFYRFDLLYISAAKRGNSLYIFKLPSLVGF